MIDKLLKIVISISGALLGYSLLGVFHNLNLLTVPQVGPWGVALQIGIIFIFGIIFLYLSRRIIDGTKNILLFVEGEIQRFSMNDILLSSIGFIIGLIIAYLVSIPIYNMDIPYIGPIIPIVVYALLGYLGITIPYKKKKDIKSFVASIKKDSKDSKDISQLVEPTSMIPKILDTSVIIDGRILDICKTRFIEGPLVIPEFVLQELQHIADSSDSLKRTRGRRGLDILNEIQKNLDIEVIIHEKKFEDIEEVDSKLLKLTKELSGKILTNDYNLNKVAEVQGITVLNINDLANAVKPVVLPGEEMDVQVVKDGKETNQGLAYLDDGTMIVVEGGKKHIGDDIKVIVTSVLQTSAGRMIFARPKMI